MASDGLFNIGKFSKKAKSKVVDETLSTLQSIPTFSDIKKNSLVQLAELMHFRDYRSQEYLYHEEDPALGLYVVQKGSVSLTKLDQSQNVHQLQLVNAGELFGEGSLIGDIRRFETAQVVTDSRLLGFFKPDLDTLLKSFPNIGAEILLALSDRFVNRQEVLWKMISERDNGIELIKESYQLDSI